METKRSTSRGYQRGTVGSVYTGLSDYAKQGPATMLSDQVKDTLMLRTIECSAYPLSSTFESQQDVLRECPD
jgi:hypothetical protein